MFYKKKKQETTEIDDKLHIQNKTEAKVYTIERYSFDAGFYRVKVFANVLGSTEKASKAALEIHHNHGTIIYHPLVAKLLGGPEVTLTEGTTLTLDASESEDPNHLTKEFMLYEWSCTQSNPVCSPKTTKGINPPY
ncbi:hypothetical protein AAG570_011568 [Ranatra chinensis]|uniref:PKD/REJ-like domain-containing protein n=1 Tax=Ranatra chinensis TaxID=642074 RepID=A0ABD0YL51_9HEMI